MSDTLARWLSGCAHRNRQTPDTTRRALVLQGQAVGSVAPAVWDMLAGHRLDALEMNAALDLAARQLHRSGLCGIWRNEFVSVRNPEGQVVGRVERGAVRVLGVATEAVHLVGLAPDGRVWLQQRALDKANDPGQWDTLMGGMVAHGESIEDTLERETREEAGLSVKALHGLRWGQPFPMSRPTDDGGRLGQLVETIHWCVVTVPEHLPPDNLDGEVAGFECLPPQTVARRVLEGQCTDEAALVLARALGWPLSPA